MPKHSSTSLAPDYGQSLAFLQRWSPKGLWVLTAIQPDGERLINTASFAPGEEAELTKWLKTFGADRNVYFSVNPVRERVNRKADRESITALDWLHVDIDPRAGEPIADEQARILTLLTTRLPAGVPPPTCIVFSGGGYQGFWRLNDPLPIDGDEAKYQHAKLYNLQLELLFGADSCHNVDRIMRLPGTLNRPNEKKRAKGRTVALAAVVAWTTLSYDLKTFVPAATVQSKTDSGLSGGVTGARVVISGNVKRLAGVGDLGPNVPEYCKTVIVNGKDPENPTKLGSRSDWLWFTVCELVRCGVSDDVIFSIITDPAFGISGHILDQDNPERSALRQIERAREHAIHPKLQELNERHGVVEDYGGRCRILSEAPDYSLSGRTRLSLQTAEDFKLRYSNQKIEFIGANGKPASVPLGVWWLSHAHRRQYSTIAFAPEGESKGAYNLWKGFAYKSKPGVCDLLLGHIRENVCDGNEGYYSYLMGWMANAVQNPASPGHTAVVLRGAQGTGKGFFVKAFGSLFGRHFLQVSNPKHLVGAFNAHLRDCVVLFGDEAFYAGDKQHESVLKTLVTEETLTIEAKGVDASTSPNYVHLLMASNNDWVVPAGANDRRFFVLDVNPNHIQDSTYFGAIQRELDSGGYEAFLHALRTRDLSAFDIRKLPQTKGLMEQKVLSFTSEKEWWYGKLVAGEIIPGLGWPEQVFCEELIADYIQATRAFNTTFRGNGTRLGMFLKKSVPPNYIFRRQIEGTHDVAGPDGRKRRVSRPYVYELPFLGQCRKIFDDRYGGPFPWPPEPPPDSPTPKDTPF